MDGYWSAFVVLKEGFSQMSIGKECYTGEQERVMPAARLGTHQTLVFYLKSMFGWLPMHKPVEISLLISPAAAEKMSALSV